MMPKEIEELFSAFQSLGYDWHEFHVYRHPRESRKYVIDIDSGCSCDYYVVPSVKTLEAETPMGKREVYAAFLRWFGVGEYVDGTKIDNMERLRSSL
jgi:hypothetical protein